MPNTIDINCDLGEGETLADCDVDALIMPFISSCNIACGGHAGNTQTMQRTLENALINDLNIGAHPGYPDPGNFGRVSIDISTSELIESIDEQITRLEIIAGELQNTLNHIKLHGALYNDVEKDRQLARSLADYFETKHKDKCIITLAHGKLLEEARSRQLKTLAEGFMDRRYTIHRQLLPRGIQGAVINSSQAAISQALALAQGKEIDTLDHESILIEAETICLHGDNPNATQIARSLANTLQQNSIQISKPGAIRD